VEGSWCRGGWHLETTDLHNDLWRFLAYEPDGVDNENDGDNAEAYPVGLQFAGHAVLTPDGIRQHPEVHKDRDDQEKDVERLEGHDSGFEEGTLNGVHISEAEEEHHGRKEHHAEEHYFVYQAALMVEVHEKPTDEADLKGGDEKTETNVDVLVTEIEDGQVGHRDGEKGHEDQYAADDEIETDVLLQIVMAVIAGMIAVI